MVVNPRITIELDSVEACRGAEQFVRCLDRIEVKAGGAGRGLKGFDTALSGVLREATSARDALSNLRLGFGLREIFQANIAFERIMTRLRKATGSARAAGQEFAFVSGEAERLGLNLRLTAEDYATEMSQRRRWRLRRRRLGFW